ncbi:MAG: HemK/PrmC family methyltransferase [Candidatus Andersenbacteria bacterium]
MAHDAVEELREVSDTPQLDVEFILRHILPDGLLPLAAHQSEVLDDALLSSVQSLLAARKTGKPLAYVLGEWDFYGRTFHIDERVLVPRPTTEQLVDTALPHIQQMAQETRKPITIADIGTGSGCVAITLLLEAPDYIQQIYATDISKDALLVARKNAERHNVLEKISFVTGDLLSPIAPFNIDLLVSNPPYVPTAELEQAASNIHTNGLTFEPRIALDGGKDGNDAVRKLLASPLPAIFEGKNGEIYQHNI